MLDIERYREYIKEHCKNCKNKTTDLCEIRIAKLNDIITTRCEFYENENPSKKKKRPQHFQKW